MTPVKKPKKRPKAKRAFNSTLPAPSKTLTSGTALRTTKPMKRGGKVKPVNRKRRASAFERAYGSKARVEWVKTQPCLTGRPYCVTEPIHNAHIKTGGTGRKADAHLIVPLCDFHHGVFHYFGRDAFESAYALDLDAAAAETERRWQAHQGAAA